MIPVRLVLTNFLSYASPGPLDFTGFDVGCLSGPNGAGKSALLDAITWAVWGSARGCESGQNQERLIRDGADDMEIDFTFELGRATYRVVRRRSRTKRPEVAFSVRDGEGWRTLAGETLKETDAKIESVLRMDYKTFTASAFFVQGRSEDFLARMKPDERKDVFARLLDLGTYERFEDVARERAKDAERERKDVATRIERLTETAPDVGEVEAQLAELTHAMKRLDERSAAATDDLRAARAALEGFRDAAAELEVERRAIASEERDAAELGAREERFRRQLTEIDELLARADEVAAALEEIDALSGRESEARQSQQRAADLDVRRGELAAVIDAERRTIEARCDDARSRVASLSEEIGSLERAKSELATIDDALASIADPASELDASRTLGESLSADGARLKEQISQLDVAESKARRSLEVLADGAGECPVCGSALDADHLSKVRRDVEDEVKTTVAARDAATAELEVARKEAVRLREEIRRLEQTAADRRRLVAEREGILGRLERFDAAAAERSALTDALARDEALLGAGTFASEARAQLVALDAQAEGLYDADAHAALRARLAELAPYASLAGRLEEASKSQRRVAEEIEGACARAAALRDRIEERARSIAGLEEQVAGLEPAGRTVAEAEGLREELLRLCADAAAEHARLSERLMNARAVATELEQARSDERSAADRHRRYRRLVEAFGPTGIPKLIIDNALPELTDEANRILGRLSDHEMSIQFVLERETKAGKSKETFDALVQHDGGVRDFAMFSGGEAFRVAFAVRLAMSKLLVRRAGARLETLVVDEGFGTQDPQGRERLVEAINLARETFAKVLVITHLDELKEQFGTQIRVSKGPAGSTLDVIGS